MPLYFFDSDDGDALVRDANGIWLPNEARARHYDLDALADMVREHIHGGGRRVLLVAIRDEAGNVIFRATTKLHGEWVRNRVER